MLGFFIKPYFWATCQFWVRILHFLKKRTLVLYLLKFPPDTLLTWPPIERKKNVPKNSLCVCVGLKPRPFLLSRGSYIWRPSISWYAPMRRWLTVEGVVGAGAWCRGGPTNDRTGRTGQGVVWGQVRGTIDPRMTGQGMTSMRMGQMR